MKRFLLQREADPTDADDVFDDADILRLVCRSPLDQRSGVDLEELDRGLRLVRAFEDRQAGDVVELEDADWQHLCEKLRAFKWARIDPRISRLCHMVLDAQEYPLADMSLNGSEPAERVREGT